MGWARNTEALVCWGCRNQVAPGLGLMAGNFPTECYHDECYRVERLIAFPGIPMACPDSDFVVGRLLRQCECGARTAGLKNAMRGNNDGADFWIECGSCERKSILQRYAACAASMWNTQRPAAMQSPPKIREVL